MINVIIEQGKITARGHAGYAPKGQDIMCGGIFSLLRPSCALSQSRCISRYGFRFKAA